MSIHPVTGALAARSKDSSLGKGHGTTLQAYYSKGTIIFFHYIVISLVALVLSACGGGGSVGTTTSPSLSSVVTFTYTAPAHSSKYYTQWEVVTLTPTVTGNIGSGIKTFRAISLPTGLTLDTVTGDVTGLPETFGVRNQNVQIELTVSGYMGYVDGIYNYDIDGFSKFGFMSGGFTLTDAISGAGTTGIPGSIHDRVVNMRFDGNGAYYGEQFPAGTLITYGFQSANDAPGATINSTTGEINWTPAAAGTYQIFWYADVSFNGITRRYIPYGSTIMTIS